MTVIAQLATAAKTVTWMLMLTAENLRLLPKFYLLTWNNRSIYLISLPVEPSAERRLNHVRVCVHGMKVWIANSKFTLKPFCETDWAPLSLVLR